jgi:glycosyltransferase involved in cell wall biosynthesis
VLVTIGICTFNRCELLAQTLDQLTRIDVPADVDFEVLVVDNASTDATAETVASASDRLPVRYALESRRGQSHARNRILAHARGEWILWTDDDVLVDRHWLSSCIDAVRRHDDAVVVGGPCEPWFPADPDPDLLRTFPGLASGFCAAPYAGGDGVMNASGVSNLMGMNMGMRRSACAELFFDPALGYSDTSTAAGEETDYVRRLLSRGGVAVWASGMRVRHYVLPSRMTLEYLTAFTFGLGRISVREEGFPSGRTLLGVPRWLYSSCIATYVEYWIQRCAGSRQSSLDSLRQYHYFRGVLHECRSISSARVKNERLALSAR